MKINKNRAILALVMHEGKILCPVHLNQSNLTFNTPSRTPSQVLETGLSTYDVLVESIFNNALNSPSSPSKIDLLKEIRSTVKCSQRTANIYKLDRKVDNKPYVNKTFATGILLNVNNPTCNKHHRWLTFEEYKQALLNWAEEQSKNTPEFRKHELVNSTIEAITALKLELVDNKDPFEDLQPA